MRKKQFAAVLGMAAAGSIFLTACASQASTPLPDVIKVENVAANGEGTLNVSSRETVKVTPDMAEIVYGITTENADASVCQQENTEKLNAVIEYLKGQGFEESSIQTSDFSLYPQYDWSGNERVLTGYEMTTQVTVTDVPMEQVGGLISDVAASGANEINSVSYFSSSYDEAYQQALTQAVNTARAKAETLAAASGQKVGAVRNIEEYGENQNAKYAASSLNLERGAVMETAAAAGSADMAVMPGEMEVAAQISVEFELIME